MSNKTFDEIIDSSRYDIWRYANLLEELEKKHFIKSHQDRFTPLEQVGNIWIKREDKSITGSHKFRSLVYQISKLQDKNENKLAILSSSGNAAISAGEYADQIKTKLFVFLSDKTPKGKLSALKTENIIPVTSSRPLRLAKYAVKHFGLPDLRPSVDINAEIGFRSLGFEIFEQMRERNLAVKNIFSFATSGASLQGIATAFAKLVQLKAIDESPKLFGVYNSSDKPTKVNKHLKKIEKICRESGGELVDISNREIMSIKIKLDEQNVQTSKEGLASFTAAEKINPNGQSVIIFTGKNWPEKSIDFSKFKKAESFAEVDKIILEIYEQD